jgi:2-(1,2-epoxy-1,2-dihydrophenyl)acetyl-CoA isomerase
MSESSDSAYETVNLTVADGLATVQLNRPQALNAWNHQFGRELHAALQGLADDQAVRALIITGAGRAFSAGADLKDFSGGEQTPSGRPHVRKTLDEVYHPIVHLIREMPKPVLAAVNGPAAGIGCSLALCCDLVLAAESSYFLLAFVNIGLVPDGGSSVFVPARAGAARAAEMTMLGERIPAAQALAWGLANRVVPDAQLHAEATALGTKLAQGPTRSYAAAKQLLNKRLYADMDEQLRLEARLQGEMVETDDFVEGVTAFLEKRPARFRAS